MKDFDYIEFRLKCCLAHLANSILIDVFVFLCGLFMYLKTIEDIMSVWFLGCIFTSLASCYISINGIDWGLLNPYGKDNPYTAWLGRLNRGSLLLLCTGFVHFYSNLLMN